MNASISDPLNMSVSDGSVVDYISHLKRYRTDNPKNCIIGHLNINSIRNKFEAVKCVLNDGLMDIFALSESKIDESFPNAQFIVNDFSLHRKDRNRFGGGILLYMRSDIPHRRRYDLELNSLAPGGFENIFQNVFFKLISWIDTLSNSCETALRSMPQNLSDDKSTLVQVMAWCRQAASHYLSQCCPSSLSPYGVTRPQWVNSQVSHGVEIMIIETRLYKMEKWFVVIIYKPPSVTIKSFENVLTEIFQSLEKESPIGLSWVIQI